MKTLAVVAGAVALVGSALVMPVTTDAAGSATGIAGVLDPATGTFTARQPLAQAAAALQRTGSITVTTTVTIDSKIPADQPISCSVSLSSFDSSFSNSASGSNDVVRSGNSGKCTTTIFYIWEVLNAATTMNVSVNVSTGSGGGTDSVSHNASFSFAPFAVPSGSKSLSVALAL
jgi:hypothetical protein